MKKCLILRPLAMGLALTLSAFVASANADIIVDDTFDDANIETNVNGIGTGFVQNAQSGGSVIAESGSIVNLESGANGGARVRITSDDRSDTVSALGTTYLFEDVLFATASDDSGDGTTFRQVLGIRNGGGAGAVDNPGDGLYLEVGNQFFTAGTTGPSTTSTLFYESGGTRTALGSFDFDNLSFDETLGVTGSSLLDFEFFSSATDYGLNITGDTAGTAPISISGTYAAAGLTNTLTSGGAFFGLQTESPNTQANIGRIQIEEITVAVPEPSSIALLGLGAIGLVNRRRRNS